MPVTRISASVDWSAKVGAGWWMARLLDVLIGAGFVHRLADHVHDAPKRLVADRHRDGLASVSHVLAAHEALGGVHGDGADRAFAQMLGDLEHQALALVGRLQRIENFGQMPVELHVDDGAHNLANLTDFIRGHSGCPCLTNDSHSASAPEMISISSLVMLACR